MSTRLYATRRTMKGLRRVRDPRLPGWILHRATRVDNDSRRIFLPRSQITQPDAPRAPFDPLEPAAQRVQTDHHQLRPQVDRRERITITGRILIAVEQRVAQ